MECATGLAAPTADILTARWSAGGMGPAKSLIHSCKIKYQIKAFCHECNMYIWPCSDFLSCDLIFVGLARRVD